MSSRTTWPFRDVAGHLARAGHRAAARHAGPGRSSASSKVSRRPVWQLSANRIFWATGWPAAACKPHRAQDFLTEAGALTAGDIVVHVDHGDRAFRRSLRATRSRGRSA